MPDEPKEMVKYIEKRVLIIASFLALSFFIIGSRDWFLGIIVGSLCSLIYLRAISTVAHTVIDASQKAARVSTVGSFIVRQLMTVIVLTISYFREEISFPAVIVGLLLVKMIIIAKSVQERWQYVLDDQLKSIKNKLERRN